MNSGVTNRFRHSHKRASILCVCVILIGLAGFAGTASNKYWDGNGSSVSNAWNAANNWDDNALPTNTSDVIFDNSLLATMPTAIGLNATANANSLTFGSSSGTALGAFTLQANTSGTASRQLNLASGNITVDSSVTGTITLGASGTGTLSLSGVSSGYQVLNNSTTQMLDIGATFGTIGATLSLNSAGGLIRLSGANTATGAASVGNTTSGTLVQLNRTTALSTFSGTTISSGSAVNLNGLNVGATKFTLNGTGISSGGVLYNSTGSATCSGAITINSDSTIKNNGTGLTLSGAMTYTGKLTLSGGAFTIGNAGSTGAGGVLIDGAAVSATKDQAFGTGTLTLTGGSLINDNGSSAISFGNNLAINGPVTINAGYVGLTFSGATQSISGSPTITLSGNNNPVNFGGVALANGSTTTFYQSTGSGGITQSAPWTGTGAALVFDMSGGATLNQANTFDGGVTVKSGTVNVNNATGLGPVGATLSIGTASATAAVVINANVSIGNLTMDPGFLLDGGAQVSSITIADGCSLTVTPTADTEVNGPITLPLGGSTGVLIKDGDKTLTLNNTFYNDGDQAGVGGVIVNGGKLVSYRGIGSATVNNSGSELDALGGIGGGVTVETGCKVVVAGGAGGAVQVNGAGLLDISATYENPMYSLNGDGSITNGLGSSMFVGEGDWSGTISGAGSLVPTGYQNGHGAAGTLIVRMAQAYTGSTYVDSGYTLKLVGATNLVASSSAIIVLTDGFLDVTDTTAFTLAAGQTLIGDGAVNGNLTVGNGSSISPGYAGNSSLANRPGTLNQTGNQTWAGGGTYVWQINDATGTEGADPGWDWVNITGDLTISAISGNKFTIDLTTLDLGRNPEAMAHFDVSQNYTWKIASCSGTLTCDDAAFAFITTHYVGPALGTLAVTHDAHNVYLHHSAAAAVVPSSWTNSATSGNWSTAGNWKPAVVPNAYGAVANFTNAFTGNPTLTVDATNTLGILNVGGAANAGRIITFTNSGSAALVFRSGSAQLTKAAGTQRTVIAVPLDVKNNLTISNNAAGDLYINAAITQDGKTIVNAGAGTGALQMGYSAGGSGPNIVQDSLTSPLVLGADTVGEVNLLSGTVRASDSTAFNSYWGLIVGNKNGTYSATGKTLMLVSDSDRAFVNGGINAYNCDWTITVGRFSSAGPGTKATMLCGLGFTQDGAVTTLTVNRLTGTVYTGESANYAVSSGTAELIFGGVWFSNSQGKNFNIAAGTRLTLGHINGDIRSGANWVGLHTTLTKQGAGTLVLSDGMALRDADGNDPDNRKGVVVEEGTLMVNKVSNDFVPNYLTVSNGAAICGNSTVDRNQTTLTLTPGALLTVPVRANGTSDALTVTGGSIDLSKLTLRIEDTSALGTGHVYTVLTSAHTGAFAGNNLPVGWSVDYSDSSKITLRGPPVHIGTVLMFR